MPLITRYLSESTILHHYNYHPAKDSSGSPALHELVLTFPYWTLQSIVSHYINPCPTEINWTISPFFPGPHSSSLQGVDTLTHLLDTAFAVKVSLCANWLAVQTVMCVFFVFSLFVLYRLGFCFLDTASVHYLALSSRFYVFQQHDFYYHFWLMYEILIERSAHPVIHSLPFCFLLRLERKYIFLLVCFEAIWLNRICVSRQDIALWFMPCSILLFWGVHYMWGSLPFRSDRFLGPGTKIDRKYMYVIIIFFTFTPLFFSLRSVSYVLFIIFCLFSAMTHSTFHVLCKPMLSWGIYESWRSGFFPLKVLFQLTLYGSLQRN